MSYKKVRGDGNQVNDIGSPHGNYISVFGDGSGRIITCFLCMLMLGTIIYLWIAFHLLLVVIIVGSTLLSFILFGSFVFRHVSNTRKQHLVNEAEIEWSKIIYQTENLVATLNRSTREITVHNAQQIQEVHHHQPLQISETAQSKNSYMPKLSDLSKGNEQ